VADATRTYWKAWSLGIANEPLLFSLVKYRRAQDRVQVDKPWEGNLVSSITTDGKQMPILDLDFPHRVGPSTNPGHSHLYLDVEMSNWQWFWFMFGLWQGGVIELGFFVWSIRRGGNFVRIPGTQKKGLDETTYPEYGWLFKRRNKK
jgi:hypothetical protein